MTDDGFLPPPGQRAVFGVHRLSAAETNTAPASRIASEAKRQAAYQRDLRNWARKARRGDAETVWDDGLPPGGCVCGTCGQPVESEPCREHQPVAWADGWATRHRGPHRELVATTWRAAPPVDDATWSLAQAARSARTHGGPVRGTKPRGHDPLGGLLFCRCGARIRTNGVQGSGRRQRIHPTWPCSQWGDHRSMPDHHDGPLAEQLTGLRLDDRTLAQVVALVALPDVPIATLDEARMSQRRRDLALDHAAGRIDDDVYLERVADLRAEAARPRTAQDGAVTPERAVGYLRDLATAWAKVTDDTRHELLRSVYERVVITRDGFVAAYLTPAAMAHGLAVALPERVQRRPRQESRLAAHTLDRIPIVGAREQRIAVRRSA